MAVRKPRKPSMPKSGNAGKRAVAAPKENLAAGIAGNIYDPRAVRRTRGFKETQAPRTRGVSKDDSFQAQEDPLPAVRKRGSRFGQYLPEEEQAKVAFPQIDPTATTNPQRPRTKQAGYDRETGILRIRFRDGTPWEYYDVPPNVWRNFRRVKSPGRFINRVLNSYEYGRGDF